MPSRIKNYFQLLRQTFLEFSADNATKLSASLAYYTIFAVGPLILVIISVAGIFLGQETITTGVYEQISGLVGSDAASQVLKISENMRQQQSTAAFFSLVGVVTLLFGATGVFAEIQDSINYIWSIRAKPKKGWLKYLRNRLLSFSLIVGLGFLLLVSLLVNTLMDILTARLMKFFGTGEVNVFKVFNLGLLYVIISSLFAIIYKVLPDARIAWKDAFVGAGFTGFMFLLGKFLIGLYLGNSGVANAYGAAASVIVVLLWVYYSSIILYFGAEFTKVYALTKGKGIIPYDTAVFIEKREVKELPFLGKVTPEDIDNIDKEIPILHQKDAGKK